MHKIVLMKKFLISTFVVVISAFFIMAICFDVYSIVYPCYYKNEISQNCKDKGLDRSLVASIIFCESRFRSDAVSSKGAIGLMQIMPQTAIHFSSFDNVEKDLLSPSVNIDVGTSFLKYLFDKYDDELTVLACYNAGEGIVRSWKKGDKLLESEILFDETRNYVKKVMSTKKYYRVYF